MAEPDWNPDTGGRSLAEILREAGIESATRQNRRRKWDDPDEAGLRQRRAEAAAAEGVAARSGHGRRSSDLSVDEPPVREQSRSSRDGAPAVERRSRPRRPADPSTAAIPGLRPDRKPGVPAAGAVPSAPVPSMSPGRAPSAPLPSGPGSSRAVSPGASRSSAPGRERQTAARPAREELHHNTGPIPVVRPEDLDELDASPRESALAWLRFAGELLIALAAGIGIYFAATLLWENIPYLAVLLVPLAVTGLVAGVGAWRERQGQEPISPRLLAVLVFAGTLLTVAPAAALLPLA
jgi:hypothetical protein